MTVTRRQFGTAEDDSGELPVVSVTPTTPVVTACSCSSHIPGAEGLDLLCLGRCHRQLQQQVIAGDYTQAIETALLIERTALSIAFALSTYMLGRSRNLLAG